MIDWSKDGTLIACAGKDKCLKIIDLRGSMSSIEIHKGKLVGTCFQLRWIAAINSVKWSPCGRFLATASDDGTVKLMEFSTSKILYEKKGATGQLASFVGNILILPSMTNRISALGNLFRGLSNLAATMLLENLCKNKSQTESLWSTSSLMGTFKLFGSDGDG